jgi:hypothetical protein
VPSTPVRFIWPQFNQVMNFSGFAGRREPGKNDSGHTFLDGDRITDLELGLIRAADNGMSGFSHFRAVSSSSILSRSTVTASRRQSCGRIRHSPFQTRMISSVAVRLGSVDRMGSIRPAARSKARASA